MGNFLYSGFWKVDHREGCGLTATYQMAVVGLGWKFNKPDQPAVFEFLVPYDDKQKLTNFLGSQKTKPCGVLSLARRVFLKDKDIMLAEIIFQLPLENFDPAFLKDIFSFTAGKNSIGNYQVVVSASRAIKFKKIEMPEKHSQAVVKFYPTIAMGKEIILIDEDDLPGIESNLFLTEN